MTLQQALDHKIVCEVKGIKGMLKRDTDLYIQLRTKFQLNLKK